MQIGQTTHTYIWHDQWATIPDTPSGRNNGRTHAVAVMPDGRVAVFAQAVPAVLFFDTDGRLIDSWGERFIGAHGLTLVMEDGQPRLWLVDQESCEVCKVTLDGRTLQRLDPPPIDERSGGKYKPTWADVNPANEEVWVADGYGGFVIHRYGPDGTYRGKLTGEEGAGRFKCPHAVRFGPDGLAYIADRGNKRVTVYDSHGKHVRHADGLCHSPCGFDFHDGLILVPELRTGVKLLDAELGMVAELGANPDIDPGPNHTATSHFDLPPEGWPNLAGTDRVQPGRFNSPHGACFAPNGDIYVSEWIIGGRITRLQRTS